MEQPQVVWREEERTLTLEGEPVLRYTLSWPEIQGAGLGGRWISRYYARLARAWRRRWEREVYWKACLALADRRAAARPFLPWTGRLAGETVLWRDGLLSLRLEGEETRGDGKPCRVRWGDVWRVKEGAPCPPRALFGGRRRWRREALAEILRQGEARRQSGNCFLDPDWAKKLRKLPIRDLCLTEEGAEAALPQCSVAPAAEGTPVFLLPTVAADGQTPG